jgi:GT2 family glycosyltransferase
MPPDDDPSQQIQGLERRIAELEQALQRATVQQQLMDGRVLTLERNRLFNWWNSIYRAAANLYARTGFDDRYAGLSDLRYPGDYARLINHEESEIVVRPLSRQPKISVVVDDASVDLSNQSYANWERCKPDDSPTGDYVMRLHAGDHLSPHALYFYARAVENDSPDIVYADEDCCDRTVPLFKPGWSPELLKATMYLGRAVLCRRGITQPNEASSARHIARVLYHRAAAAVIGQNACTDNAPRDARLSIIICSRDLGRVRACLKAVRRTASIPVELLIVHHLESTDAGEMRHYVEQIGGIWIPYRGRFHFARMNNLAAAKATAPFLLFLNDDVILGERGWDHKLTMSLTQTNIGVAGGILEYPNGTIQHAGVVTGMGDAVGHCGRFQRKSELWPWLRMSRDVSAVTGAMLAMRADVFRMLHGFDERFPVNYNDVDMCLSVKKAGMRVVCLNLGKVVHRESQTRTGGTTHEERAMLYSKWSSVLGRPDEFYSPHLAPMERIALNIHADSPLQGFGIGRQSSLDQRV